MAMGRPKLDMSIANLTIDLNVDLFMYLIKGIRFGSWKDQRFSWALQIKFTYILKQSGIRVKWQWNPVNC